MSATASDDAPPLRVPKSRLNTAQSLAPLRVLSLTGGGYRGLFTAQVLVDLCGLTRQPGRLDRAIDVFAGTSIGGLMACALAIGVAPRRVLDAIDEHGPSVFPGKRQRTLRRIVFGTLYDATNLRKAIEECLGKTGARTKLKDVKKGLVVPAVDWINGRTEWYTSGALGKSLAQDVTLLDVCLATSAAPTYFPPHEVDGTPMLDGGLVSNNPDAGALIEIGRRWPERMSRVEMLSIGTAGSDIKRSSRTASKPGAKWAVSLATFMMTVQERSASTSATRLLGRRYLRVNHEPTEPHDAFDSMDVVTEHTRQALLNAGQATALAAYKTHRAFIDRMLNEHRGQGASR